MFNFFKNFRKEPNEDRKELNTESAPESVTPKKKRNTSSRKTVQLSPKELATRNGEPWIQIINLELDPNNLGNGAIELDWNDIFVARLVKAGFKGKTDHQIVDQWFTTVCRNIVLETYEQEMADPDRRSTTKRDIGNGRSEFS
jgi:hypothetical protein